VTIAISTVNIDDTTLNLTLQPDTGSPVMTTASLVNGSATATATFQSGFTRLFVSATW
jgi:hypothetical protein